MSLQNKFGNLAGLHYLRSKLCGDDLSCLVLGAKNSLLTILIIAKIISNEALLFKF